MMHVNCDSLLLQGKIHEISSNKIESVCLGKVEMAAFKLIAIQEVHNVKPMNDKHVLIGFA